MDRLTAEQAAVISAYTGFLIGDFSAMHAYVEKIMGRPVWTHEMGSESVQDEIRKRARADFLALNPTTVAAVN